MVSMTMTMVTVDVFYETSPGCLLLPEAHWWPIRHALTECLLLPLTLHVPVTDDLRHHRNPHLHLPLWHHYLLHRLRRLHHLLEPIAHRWPMAHASPPPLFGPVVPPQSFPQSGSEAQVRAAPLPALGSAAPPQHAPPSECAPLAHASPLPAPEPAEPQRSAPLCGPGDASGGDGGHGGAYGDHGDGDGGHDVRGRGVCGRDAQPYHSCHPCHPSHPRHLCHSSCPSRPCRPRCRRGLHRQSRHLRCRP